MPGRSERALPHAEHTASRVRRGDLVEDCPLAPDTHARTPVTGRPGQPRSARSAALAGHRREGGDRTWEAAVRHDQCGHADRGDRPEDAATPPRLHYSMAVYSMAVSCCIRTGRPPAVKAGGVWAVDPRDVGRLDAGALLVHAAPRIGRPPGFDRAPRRRPGAPRRRSWRRPGSRRPAPESGAAHEVGARRAGVGPRPRGRSLRGSGGECQDRACATPGPPPGAARSDSGSLSRERP